VRANRAGGLDSFLRSTGNRNAGRLLGLENGSILSEPLNRPVQAKLRVGEADDPLEAEADRVADRVMNPQAGEQPGSHAAGAGGMVQRKACPGDGIATAPPAVGEVARSPGEALDSPSRAFFEARFGQDFGGVRLHTDALAAGGAQSIDARAYTVGSDIVLDPAESAAGSPDRQALLAHELAHVVQQGAAGGELVQRQPKTGDSKAGPEKSKGARFLFRVKVTGAMTVEELLREFIRQYYKINSEEAVEKRASDWQIRGDNPATEADVKRGYKDVWVEDESIPGESAEEKKEGQKTFQTLKPDEQAAINAEANREFWDKTHYKEGHRLGTSPKDQAEAQYWIAVRDQLVRAKKSIDELPANVKAFLFHGDAPRSVEPADYQTVLNIAEKLKKLSDAELADYESKVNATAYGWADMDASIDRYLAARAERKKEEEQHEATAAQLFGLEELYRLWKDWKSLKGSASMIVGTDEFGVRDPNKPLVQNWAEQRKVRLEDGLRARGIASIDDFETMIENYRVAFRDETVALALEVLAKYEHVLFEEKKKYSRPETGPSLAAAIGKTTAAADYKEAADKESQALLADVSSDPIEKKFQKPEERERPMRLRKEAAATREHADQSVVAASLDDPLIKDREFPKSKLANAAPEAVQGLMLDYIQDRYDDVGEARKEFRDNPEKVFSLDDLISASMQAQGIDETTIYGMIVADHLKKKALKKFFTNLVLGVIALALAVLVPGAGWAAAIALTATAVISTVQAVQAYQEYEEQSRDYRLHFLSEKPSFAWVVVAIAGAALDIGASAGAIVKLRGALEAFSESEKDAAALAKLEEALNQASELKEEARLALKRAAEAEVKSKAAWKEAFASGGRLNAMMGADPVAAGKFLKAIYYTIKRGVTKLTALRSDAEFVKVAGNITGLTGKEAETLEAAFKEVRDIVDIGRARKMDDATVLSFVDRWAKERSGGQAAFEKLTADMEAVKVADTTIVGGRALTPQQQHALNAAIKARNDVSLAKAERVTLLDEQKRLMKLQANPATKSPENVETLREIEERLKELDDTYKAGKKVAEGKITRLEHLAKSAEEEAARLKLTLYDRIRAATPTDAAREAVLKGVSVDQVGALKGEATTLTVDHIVPVREITEMEGFSKLSWEDQKAVVDMRENLVAMDGAANSSKGDLNWKNWNNWKNYYSDPLLRDRMITLENKVRELISKKIAELRPK
jgi:hypothetical protein